MDRYFENGDIEEKRLIVSSMFPDFLEFYGTRHRTPKLNSAITLIYQNNNKLQGKGKDHAEFLGAVFFKHTISLPYRERIGCL